MNVTQGILQEGSVPSPVQLGLDLLLILRFYSYNTQQPTSLGLLCDSWLWERKREEVGFGRRR